MDRLSEAHAESTRAMKDVLTIHPEARRGGKDQGVAVVHKTSRVEGQEALQIIASQRDYVLRASSGADVKRVIKDFTKIPSGVNLRNRCAVAANRQIEELLPVSRRYRMSACCSILALSSLSLANQQTQPLRRKRGMFDSDAAKPSYLKRTRTSNTQLSSDSLTGLSTNAWSGSGAKPIHLSSS